MKHRYLTPEDIKNICKPKLVNIKRGELGLYAKMIEEKLSKDGKGPFGKNTQWEEDGVKYSSWQFRGGSIMINCGDGGAKLLYEAFLNEGKNKQL